MGERGGYFGQRAGENADPSGVYILFFPNKIFKIFIFLYTFYLIVLYLADIVRIKFSPVVERGANNEQNLLQETIYVRLALSHV